MFLYKKGAECMTGAMRRVFLRKKEQWKTAEDYYKAKQRTQEEGQKTSRINMAEDILANRLGEKRQNKDSGAFRFNSDQTNVS